MTVSSPLCRIQGPPPPRASSLYVPSWRKVKTAWGEGQKPKDTISTFLLFPIITHTTLPRWNGLENVDPLLIRKGKKIKKELWRAWYMSDRQVDSNCEWIGWSFLCGHKQDTMEIWGVVAIAMGGKRMCEFILYRFHSLRRERLFGLSCHSIFNTTWYFGRAHCPRFLLGNWKNKTF